MTDSGKEPGSLRHGHRKRLKQRFLAACRAGSLDALQDYEYLELLLFQGLPRRDVKPLAKELIARFGGVGPTLSASHEQLTTIVGQSGALAIKIAAAAATWMLRESILHKPILSSWEQVLDYCHAAMAHQDTESFRILFLNRKNILIADEVQQRGTIDQTPVYPREVAKRSLELGASALIMVHNHPSGDPQPSPADLEMTKRIQETITAIDVTLHDHIIIGRNGYCSFRTDGLI